MNRRILLSLTLASIGTVAVPAFAQTAPTMNQPDNGFYEGADPEWATLHSTDVRGTPVHRQYHREAVRTHLQWHSDSQMVRNTAAYDTPHRIVHQDRNMDHRHFHSDPTDFDVSTNSNGTGSNDTASAPSPTVTAGTNTTPQQTAAGRPSRLSIIQDAEEQNAMRSILQ